MKARASADMMADGGCGLRVRAWLKKKRLLHFFVIYAAINFALVLGYGFYESLTAEAVQLKPVLPSGTDWGMFGLSVAILPLSLLLEEAAFRLMPKIVFNAWSVKMEHGKGFVAYLIVAGVWASMVHQFNVVSAEPLGRMIYFSIQLFSGIYFAYYFLRHGLVAVWILHTGWDFLLVSITLLQLLLS